MRNFSLHSFPTIATIIESMILRLAERVARMVENINEYRVLVGISEGKRPHRRGEYNIRKAVKDIGWEGMGYIRLAQDRDSWQSVMSTVMNLLRNCSLFQEGLSSMALVC